MGEANDMTTHEVADSVAYCGLVCAYCHLAGSCGGCRSQANCCGRHLSPGGCFQYNCCVEKGINGCWECPDFPCGEDMFSDSHDVRLRAFVRFAKENGLECLAKAVHQNQQNGVIYGHNRDYDGRGSEEAVLELLWQGLATKRE
jgi:hypothetical protein